MTRLPSEIKSFITAINEAVSNANIEIAADTLHLLRNRLYDNGVSLYVLAAEERRPETTQKD